VGPTRPVRRQRDSEREGSIGCGGVSGHDRPDAFGRVVELTGIDQTPGVMRPISSSGTSSRVVSNAN
jgi:hypothetical protein